MTDLIDREELKKRYVATAQSGGYLGDAMSIATNHLTRLLRLIDEAPVVEPKKGEWVWDDFNHVWFCSECSRNPTRGLGVQASNNLYGFCPNCGADMRGESDA